jgi:hypothetical protein
MPSSQALAGGSQAALISEPDGAVHRSLNLDRVHLGAADRHAVGRVESWRHAYTNDNLVEAARPTSLTRAPEASKKEDEMWAPVR